MIVGYETRPGPFFRRMADLCEDHEQESEEMFFHDVLIYGKFTENPRNTLGPMRRAVRPVMAQRGLASLREAHACRDPSVFDPLQDPSCWPPR